jgi:hypothetical protein
MMHLAHQGAPEAGDWRRMMHLAHGIAPLGAIW